jgi:hypothetical protein
VKLLNDRFVANKLSLNLSRTCCMVFPPNQRDKVERVVDGFKLGNVSHCKYLGIMLDVELQRSAHIDGIFSKLVKFTAIFYKLRSKLPPSIMQKIYFAFVHPHILYGIELYANTYPTYLDKLMKLNNKILRILQNKWILTPVLELHVNYNILPRVKLHIQQLLVLVHKCMHHIQQLLVLVHKCMHHIEILPDVFANYFTVDKSIHIYNTRATGDIHISKLLQLSPDEW